MIYDGVQINTSKQIENVLKFFHEDAHCLYLSIIYHFISIVFEMNLLFISFVFILIYKLQKKQKSIITPRIIFYF